MLGDYAFGVAVAGIAGLLVVFGHRSGRWRAALWPPVLGALPLLVLDGLRFGLDLDPFGLYCGEPSCDPGPLPLSLGILYLLGMSGFVALGIVTRKMITRRRLRPADRDGRGWPG